MSTATAIEYALIASLIAVFLIGALSALDSKMSSEMSSSPDQIVTPDKSQ